jgi:hypothetical protein
MQMSHRVATAIGQIVMAYGRMDQQIYYQIGHLKTERFMRALKKGSPLPPDELIQRRFKPTVKFYRRLCSELSSDDPLLMRDVDEFIRRLHLAVACRDDLVHGWDWKMWQKLCHTRKKEHSCNQRVCHE